MRNLGRLGFIFLISIFLSACDTTENYAPVADIGMIESIPRVGNKIVSQGETLYTLAWRYGLDYRYLAKINHINPPYVIRPGQVIFLKPNMHFSTSARSMIKAQPLMFTAHAPISNLPKEPLVAESKETEPHFSVRKWMWPLNGRIVKTFAGLNKGINIAGNTGDPVYASAAGKVVYAGNGLRGYGNLIILKHNTLFLSAYANNTILFVKAGDWVRQGQKIAEVGGRRNEKPILHFEIRRAGIPINPVEMLRMT